MYSALITFIATVSELIEHHLISVYVFYRRLGVAHTAGNIAFNSGKSSVLRDISFETTTNVTDTILIILLMMNI